MSIQQVVKELRAIGCNDWPKRIEAELAKLPKLSDGTVTPPAKPPTIEDRLTALEKFVEKLKTLPGINGMFD